MKPVSMAVRQSVWEATYAAAFVAEVNRALGTVDTLGRGVSFDRALENNAETAIAIADAAVKQLVDWCEREDRPAKFREE